MQQQSLQDRAAGPAPPGPSAPAGADAVSRAPADGYVADPPGAAQPRRPGPQHAAARPAAIVHRDTGAVLLLAGLSTTAATTFDVLLTERLSMFFDLCFVLVGLAAALVVKRAGFFAVGVLPPLLLGAVVAVLTLLAPSALTASHLAFVSTWLTGLAHHGAALVATHVVVLAILGLRLPQTAR